MPNTPSPAPAPGDELLDERQVAGMLAVSPRTLQRWRRDGDGPPWAKLGPRSIRYRRGAVQAYLRDREGAA